MKRIKEFVLLLILTYIFLAFCNWNFSPQFWNGFSRFVGIVVVFSGLSYTFKIFK